VQLRTDQQRVNMRDIFFTMDCTDVKLEGLNNDMHPVSSPTLLTLILENTGIKTLESDVFSQLTKVTRLDLSRNQLQTLDYRLFINLTELRCLDITNNRLIFLYSCVRAS